MKPASVTTNSSPNWAYLCCRDALSQAAGSNSLPSSAHHRKQDREQKIDCPGKKWDSGNPGKGVHPPLVFGKDIEIEYKKKTQHGRTDGMVLVSCQVVVKGLPFPVSNDSWRVEWTETVRGFNGALLLDPQTYEATLAVQVQPPTTDAQVMKNPCGIYITGLSFSKVLAAANEQRESVNGSNSLNCRAKDLF